MSLIPEETLTEIRQRLRAHHEPLTFSCGEACFVLAHHDVRALLDDNEQLRAQLAKEQDANAQLGIKLTDALAALAAEGCSVVADSPTPDPSSKVTTSDDEPEQLPILIGREHDKPWGAPIIRCACPSCGRIADRRSGAWRNFISGRIEARMSCEPGLDERDCWRTWDVTVLVDQSQPAAAPSTPDTDKAAA